MKENKITQPESREIQRSDINFANYNPRKITQEARKNLKANLKRVGLLGGIVWNEVTGNLVSGHQRISVIDEVNKYNPDTRTNDYLIRVEVVHMDEKTEKEQNIFMNNRSVQGDFDSDMLKDMLDGIDYSLAGLNDFDLNMLGIGDLDFSINDDIWRKEDILDDSLSAIDEATKEGKENKDINRSNNFYEDSKENQIVRHNEVQKIKDRISNQNSFEKDNGMLSYVVLSFNSPTERANFMKMFGYGFEERYIDGKEFMDRIEFGGRIMANEQNLTQKGKRISTERAQELARLSAESRRQKKELVKTAREFAIAALNAETTDDKGRKYIVKDAMIKKLIAKAVGDADLNAIRYLLELIGESPADENQKIANADIPTDIEHGINIDSWIKDKLK